MMQPKAWMAPEIKEYQMLLEITGEDDKCGSVSDIFSDLTPLDGVILPEELCLEV